MEKKAIIFSAPSGAGKTTIVNRVLQEFSELKFSISTTTRARRKGEMDGKDYCFLEKIDFLDKKDNHEFLEWEEVYKGVFYGTLKSEIVRIWQAGYHVIFDVDVKGGISLKKYFGNRALAIFINVPNVKVLQERLIHRKTDTKKVIQERVNKAVKEIQYKDNFDEIIVNDNLEEAVFHACQLVKSFI